MSGSGLPLMLVWSYAEDEVARASISSKQGGCVAVSSAEACMMLKTTSPCEDDANTIDRLRKHCELYGHSDEARSDVLCPSSFQQAGVLARSDIAAVMSSSMSDGMSIHERMRHWWSTRGTAEALHDLDGTLLLPADGGVDGVDHSSAAKRWSHSLQAGLRFFGASPQHCRAIHPGALQRGVFADKRLAHGWLADDICAGLLHVHHLASLLSA